MIAKNQRPQEFIWASEKNANVREPLQALKEKGWQFADIPTASNFNWLINELGTWDRYLDNRIDLVGNDLQKEVGKFNEQLKETRYDLKMAVEVIAALVEKIMHHHPQPPLRREPKLPVIRNAGGIGND